jgi:hypothetical protein
MNNYNCDRCGYSTYKKFLLIKHLSRKKPCPVLLNNIEPNEIIDSYDKEYKYICNKCNKKFLNRISKYRHQKKCNIDSSNNKIEENIINNENEDSDNLNDTIWIDDDADNILNDPPPIPHITHITTPIILPNIDIQVNKDTEEKKEIIQPIIEEQPTVNISIKECISKNKSILPYTKYDIGILFKDNSNELKNLIKNDIKGNKNFELINNIIKLFYFNENVGNNLNSCYDESKNKIIIKISNGVSERYLIEDFLADFINQIKLLLTNLLKNKYGNIKLNNLESEYILDKIDKYKIDNNYDYLLNLLKENTKLVINQYNKTLLLQNESNIVRIKTKLRRPIDLHLEGKVDFTNPDKFTDKLYRGEKFYWDTFNDTYYYYDSKKFVGKRMSVVNRMNGYDTDGNPLD